MPGISAVIITLNEEKNIERCIRSLSNVSDEIIVVDSNSTDRTAELATALGAQVFTNPFEGYKEQKNFAVTKANNKYVLSLDADEALSVELEASILNEKEDLAFDGYTFNRFNHYCGSWIKHSNWYPDKKLRLFNSELGEWGGINPHDKYILPGKSKIKHIGGNLLHWVLDSYEEHIQKANNFSSIAAKEYYKLGRNIGVSGMILHMIWRFIKAYFLKGGFRDGYNGFAISTLSSYTSFLKYLKLRQLHKEDNQHINKKNKTTDIKIAGQ